MKSLLPCLAVTLLIVISAHPSAMAANPDSGVLRQLEAEFMKAALEKGSQGYMSYYAEEAVELPNGADALRGKAAIAATMGFLDQKGNRLTWAPVGEDMSASGDLGYTWGTYEFRSHDQAGKETVSYGKYTTIWKKQKDGKWKIVLDMGNSSPTPKP